MESRLNIGIIGSRFYRDHRKIKDTIFKLVQKYGETLTIVSGGCNAGADKFAKKFALELGCGYREYNPSHTQKNLYSALHENFYNKKYKPSNYYHRNKLLAKGVDCIIAFIPENTKANGTKDTIQHAKKFNKKVVIIN